MLKIRRVSAKNGTRIYLSGELRCAHLADLLAEIEQGVLPLTLDLEEVDIVDIEGIRLLNECRVRGIQVVNCPPYIHAWMLQEKQFRCEQ